MNITSNNTKMQPETTDSKKLSRSEFRRQQKAAKKAEKAEAKKKVKQSTQAQYDEALLQKAEEISKNLKAQTWRELEVGGKFSKNDKLSLPSRDELSQLQKHAEYDNSVRTVTNSDFNISEDNVYLFQVRLSLEKQLSALCNMFQYSDRRSMYSMVQFLIQHEVLDRNIAGLIREVINIANRGVHGEIIDDEYLQFIKKTYPVVKNALEKEYNFYSNNGYYFECPRCKYRGPSKYSNECPKCGFVSDDD